MQIQIIHDQLMREAIARQAGYEISTEGDSFLIAFNTCHAAMSFCLDIQGRLLEQSWDKDVLSLSACKVVKGMRSGAADPLMAVFLLPASQPLQDVVSMVALLRSLNLR